MDESVFRIVSLCFNILSSIFVVVIFCVVKFNDLKHIDQDLQKLNQKYDSMQKEFVELVKVVSRVDGYIRGKQDS